jgi:predicted PurR-regulated permease PerM
MGETKEIERSVQMRLYALHKRQFVGVFAVFFICLFITLLIGIAGPTVIESSNYQPDTQPKQISGPYVLKSEYLDKFRQRLWLTMKATTDIIDEFHQSINVTIAVNDSSSSSTQPNYERQRTIHCQKQVSQIIEIFR